MSEQPIQKMSQKAAFAVFVTVMILFGPYIITVFTGTIFVTSPDWWAKASLPTFITAAVVAVLVTPFFYKMVKSINNKSQRWSAIIMGPIICATAVICFVLFSLPVVMTKISPAETSYEVTVASTQRRGKNRCDFPFSIEEVSQSFCAANASAHQELRPGTKIALFGQGNQWGLFVDGYELLQ